MPGHEPASLAAVLAHYRVDDRQPEAWPAANDADDDSDDETQLQPARAAAKGRSNNRQSRTKSRYSVLEMTGGRGPNGDRARKDMQKFLAQDEPDALGMRTTVMTSLRKNNVDVEADQIRNRFLLSSTTFSPSAYLSTVHSETQTEDLMKGLRYLNSSIEQKSASLKVLVENNFERFVRAKTTIDSVYNEMRNQGLDPESQQQQQTHGRHTSRSSNHFRNSSGHEIGQQHPEAVKKKHALVKESDYGTLGIKAPLLDVAVNAEDIWGPALGGRDREENLKTVLESFQKAEGIFEIGGQISLAIRQKDYDGLVRHYSRAKQYADDAREAADSSARTGMALSDPEVHQLVITARMWLDVEEQIKNFKRDMWKELTSVQANLAMSTDKNRQDEHMTLIGILLELGVEDNPIWLWLLSRYDYVRDRITATFNRSRIEIEALRRRLGAMEKPGMHAAAIHFQSPSKLSKDDLTKNFDSAPVLEMWEMIMHCMTRLLSAQGGVLGELLDFWEKAQSFMNGSAQKGLPTGVDGSSAKHHRLSSDGVRDLQNGVGELVDLLRDSLLQIFADPPIEDLSGLMSPTNGDFKERDGSKTPLTAGLLSPLSAIEPHFKFDGFGLPPSPTTGNRKDDYSFWPPHANSLSGVHYLGEILKLVGTAAAELATVRALPSQQPAEKLKVMLNVARERCTRAVIAAWKSDAETCKVLEDWTRGSDKAVTRMPQRYAAFEGHVLSGLQQMLYLHGAAQGRANTAEIIVPPPGKLISLVRSAFTSGLFATLSGLVENAEHPVNGPQDLWSSDGGAAAQVRSTWSSLDETIDVNNKVSLHPLSSTIDLPLTTSQNLRVILTFSNLKALQAEIVPQLVTQFETDFSVKLTEETQSISDSLAKIEKLLFANYTSTYTSALSATISAGISSASWAPSSPKPTQVRPYVYDILLQLVYVHTEVSSTTPNLVPQILSHMLEQVSRALLEAFRKRARFPLPALMQATLDVEFIAQTLSQYSTEESSASQGEVYSLLDKGTDAGSRARLQAELAEMRGTLKRLREATKSEFACFKKEKVGRK